MQKVSIILYSSIVALGFLMLHTLDTYAEEAYTYGSYQNVSSVCADESKVGHLVPCARHCDNPATPNDETEPCSVCHLIVLGHNIVEYVVFISVFIAFAVIVFAGVMYVVSAGNQGMITSAKAALKAALFGMAFVLAAWVIVNTIITVFLKPKQSALQGDWRQYYCDVSDNTGTGSTADNTGTGSTADNTGSGTENGENTYGRKNNARDQEQTSGDDAVLKEFLKQNIEGPEELIAP